MKNEWSLTMREPIDWSKVSSPLSRQRARGEQSRKRLGWPKWDQAEKEKQGRHRDALERRAKFHIVR